MKFYEFKLYEYDQAKTIQNFGDKILAAARKDTTVPRDTQTELRNPQMSEENRTNILQFFMQQFESADPTPQKKYVQAIAKMYGNGQSLLEDITTTLSEYLTKFDEMNRKKAIPVPRNDFNRYRDLNEFYNMVDEYWPEYAKKRDAKLGQGVTVKNPPYPEAQYKIIYGKLSPNFEILSDALIVQPLNADADEWWAKQYPEPDTKNRWCTAYRSGKGGHWDYYSKQGPIYILIPRDRQEPQEKYQFLFHDQNPKQNQYKDWQDHEIGQKGYVDLAQRFPNAIRVFREYANQASILPWMVDNYVEVLQSALPEVQEFVNGMITNNAAAIANKGLEQLREFSLDLPMEIEEEIVSQFNDIVAAVPATLSKKGGYWDQIQNNPSAAVAPDKLEDILARDGNLKKLIDDSDAARTLLHTLKTNPKSHGNWQWHESAGDHALDLGLRDPLHRIIIRQTARAYMDAIKRAQAQQDQQAGA